MRVIIAAIHGILTGQTNPAWPDKFSAWMYGRDPEVHVTTRHYWAGPFPRWNCWIKDPWLARSLANELELFLTHHESRTTPPPSLPPVPVQGSGFEVQGSRFSAVPSTPSATFDPPSPPQPSPPPPPPIWFVAHSNGAVIALLATKRLIARGYQIGGLILTGAACQADIEKNGILDWWSRGALGAGLAYSSPDDQILDGAPLPTPFNPGALALSFLPSGRGLLLRSVLGLLRNWLWGKLIWPYGCLGRTGWLRGGRTVGSPQSPGSLKSQISSFQSGGSSPQSKVHSPQSEEHDPGLRPNSAAPAAVAGFTAPLEPSPIITRWFPGGHGTYFNGQNCERTFEQIYQDICVHLSPSVVGPSPGS